LFSLQVPNDNWNFQTFSRRTNMVKKCLLIFQEARFGIVKFVWKPYSLPEKDFYNTLNIIK